MNRGTIPITEGFDPLMVAYSEHHTQKTAQPSTDTRTLRINLKGPLLLVPPPMKTSGFFLSKASPQQYPLPHSPARVQFRSSSSPTRINLIVSNCFSDLFHLPSHQPPQNPVPVPQHATLATSPGPLVLQALCNLDTGLSFQLASPQHPSLYNSLPA